MGTNLTWKVLRFQNAKVLHWYTELPIPKILKLPANNTVHEQKLICIRQAARSPHGPSIHQRVWQPTAL